MDPFYQIRENTLRLPGVKGTHVFLHVSDTHVSTLDALCRALNCQPADLLEYVPEEDFAAEGE